MLIHFILGKRKKKSLCFSSFAFPRTFSALSSQGGGDSPRHCRRDPLGRTHTRRPAKKTLGEAKNVKPTVVPSGPGSLGRYFPFLGSGKHAGPNPERQVQRATTPPPFSARPPVGEEALAARPPAEGAQISLESTSFLLPAPLPPAVTPGGVS